MISVDIVLAVLNLVVGIACIYFEMRRANVQ